MLDISSLEKATTSLQQAIDVTNDHSFFSALTPIQKKAFKAGVIQNFEFTYELCWKFMKRWLEHNLGSVYVDGVSRRELFRLAAEHQLIDSVDQWMFYHRSRNLTSHTYDENTAEEVFKTSLSFINSSSDLLDCIKAKND